MHSHPLSQQYLKGVLHYDPSTGSFTWKIRTARRIRIGDVAGSITKKGYVSIRIDGQPYQAHRLAFLYMTGSFPSDLVDHDNRNRLDNRWVNLVDATPVSNARNAKLSVTNTSGCTGVYWDTDKGAWCAVIMVNQRSIRLGKFDDMGSAVAARKAAERLYSFHPNHGIAA